MSLSKFTCGQMSNASETRQNAYKMSDHRYRSNGLANESFPQAASNTSTHKYQQNSQNHQTEVQETQLPAKKKCSNIKCPLKTPEKTDDTPSAPLSSPKTVEVTDQTSQESQQKNTLESSSHIVREVAHTVNQIISYEEEAFNKIEEITKDIEKMYQEMEKVEKFEQISEYKKFEEFFLQKNIELDNVDPKNNEQIREFRKAAVKYVQDCMYNLDQKQNVGVEL